MNKGVKTMLIAGLLVAGAGTAQAQFGDVINRAKKAAGDAGINTGGGQRGSYTNTEAVNALKEALKIGTQNASGRLSTVNGFFGNQLIKILMPPEAKKVENTLRNIGMGGHVDKAILSMNRAAEDASGKAVQIFVNAISGMSVSDGISIVRGGQGAATNYLKNRTTGELTNAFRPIVNNSLNQVNATKYWSDVFTVYNRLPTTREKVNTDLVAYVTERALNGLFVTIADEENKIRTNPAARITDILKKVFGAP
jgi:hypothetical protein